MKCIYCGKEVGFLKSHHMECDTSIQETVIQVKQILDACSNQTITKEIAKEKILNTMRSASIYNTYVYNRYGKIVMKKETILYVDNDFKLLETKNRCQMKSTGYRYEKKPIWNVSTICLGNQITIICTDENIYFLNNETYMLFPYKKILDFGYDEELKQTYNKIKTSSPYPHELSIKAFLKHEEQKPISIFQLLHCAIDI